VAGHFFRQRNRKTNFFFSPGRQSMTAKGRSPARLKAEASFKAFLALGGTVALGNDSGSMAGVQVDAHSAGSSEKEILIMIKGFGNPSDRKAQ
jgi:hypothetical protein